ncbi:protoporphyrinogen/coproporphyrinogen oxidase [Streptomyces albipurpureus]|uniref:FAD-dependent oxidoreductase n=1 Tax=Streptomyces albipurpureus TaxID=2897419 RepID=A0ABT0UFN2_9ACTN|nr:NAD(P)/FAD-dependent oxidoreductase [Streptomyces sp. CWNU-1]MCM2387195.1 FAD-dependent oxidoreductase [Streptomyces sp. CWNU-1]
MAAQTNTRNVIVIGSGIAGTAAAFRLRQAGHQVTLLERENYLGGRMSSYVKVNENAQYRIDRGASWLSRNYQPMIKLLEEAGLASRMLPCSNELGVLRDGRIHRLSFVRPSDLLRTGLLGWRSKLKALHLLRDLATARRSLSWNDMSKAAEIDIESAQDYALRRLDRPLLDYLVEPLCSTQFLAPADEVAAVGAFSIMWGTFGAASFTFDGGVGQLPTLLLDLPLMRSEDVRVELNAQVNEVRPHEGGVQVTWERDGTSHVEHGHACVVAVPGPIAANIVTSLTDDQRIYLTGLRYTNDVHVTFGLREAPRETALGVAVPLRVHPDLCVVLYEHNLGPGRAPSGRGLISLVFRHHWSAARITLDDTAVIRDSLTAVNETLPDLAAHIDEHREMAAVQRWDRAVLARPAGGYRDLARFTGSLDPRSPIQLAGDYFAYSTTNASLATGEQAAQRIIAASHPAP